ncbi:MAG TPA: hypothetical protein VMU30_08915 [Bacteroidota bacterium]|nr:hypothetical protein [Bacteroidota bacterium]
MLTKKLILCASIIALLLCTFVVYPLINRPVSAEQKLYTGTENHFITLQEGITLTKAFRHSAPANAVLAQYFGKNALEAALAQPGCVGLRMYYAKHKDGSPTLVIVSVDHSGNDMTKGIVMQQAVPCGGSCAEGSELKQDNAFATLR